MDALIALLCARHLALMTVVLAILAVIWWKKGGGGGPLAVIMLALAAAVLYETVTGEPVTTIPARVNRLLSHEEPLETSNNPHYYRSPEEVKKLLEE